MERLLRFTHRRRNHPDGTGDLPDGLGDLSDRPGDLSDRRGNFPHRPGNLADRSLSVPCRLRDLGGALLVARQIAAGANTHLDVVCCPAPTWPALLRGASAMLGSGFAESQAIQRITDHR